MIKPVSLKKFIFFLVLCISVIQIIHFTLISRDDVAKKLNYSKEEAKVRKVAFQSLIQEMIEEYNHNFILDSSGTYLVYSDITKMSKPFKYDFILATHTSLNNLHFVTKQSEIWDGILSVSVFTIDKYVLDALAAIAYLTICFDKIKEKTKFHLSVVLSASKATSVPSQNLSEKALSVSESLNFNCHSDVRNIISKNEANRLNYDTDFSVPYPNNFLRNVAIQSLDSKYVLVIDIDMLPSPKLYASFINQEASHFDHDSHIYILPAFEKKSDTPMPMSKKELLTQWTNGKIRPFYSYVCDACQSRTNYTNWRSIVNEIDSNDLKIVSSTMSWMNPWEPFYIVKTPFPPYDERFKQYGKNRISQICEMHVAGYTMNVLDNAYIVHEGFKYPEEFHKTKAEELFANRKLFETFKFELKTKYPNSRRMC